MALAAEASQSGEATRLLSSKSDAGAASETSSVSGMSAADLFDRADPSETSFRKDLEVQPSVPSRSEEYRQLFRLPPDEMLVQDFNCALQESIFIQGHMYLFCQYVCFYSNIFGFETKRIIRFHEITCVRKAKTAAIFPNAIEIVAEGKKHFFASFLSRDEAYRLIIDGWSQNCPSGGAFVDRQEFKSDCVSLDNDLVPSEKFKNLKQSANELERLEREKDPGATEESETSSNSEDNMAASVQLAEVRERKEDAVPPTCQVPWTGKREDIDAPEVPGHYAMVAESTFPIQVEEFFTHFFSDNAVDFVEAFHRKCGDKDFRCTQWYNHEQFGHARDLSFLHPIKIYFGARYGSCQEVQKFRFYRDSHLVIETSQQINDVPYGDYFCVQCLWDVEQRSNEENSCVLRVFVNVAFSRKTMWKGKIEQSTIEECKEAYAIWISSAHEVLNRRKKRATSKGVPNIDSANPGSSKKPEGPSKRSENPESVTAHVSPPSNNQDSSNSNDSASWGSLLGKSWASFSCHLTTQKNFSVVLLIGVLLMLVVMQLSIVLLLTRTPEVRLIPRENFRDDLISSERAEALAWLEKRVLDLKEDMITVEARLERMRLEYVFLKSRLQDFETR